MQGEDNRVVRKRMDIFPQEILQKARGRRVSVQDVDNPQREIRSRMDKSSSALWKYFDFSGRRCLCSFEAVSTNVHRYSRSRDDTNDASR